MNIGQVVRDAVGQVAPTLGSALGGPVGGAVGRQVSQVLTGRPDASEDALRAAVADMTPEQVTALVALEEQITRREQIHADDRANARDRQVSTKDPIPAILAIAAFAGFVALVAGLFFIAPPEGNQRLIDTALGILATLTIGGFAFFHGSSQGSKNKTEMMAKR